MNRKRIQATRVYNTLKKFGLGTMFFYYPSYTALGNYSNPTACGLSAIINQCIPSVQISPFKEAKAVISHYRLTAHRHHASPTILNIRLLLPPISFRHPCGEKARVLVSARRGSWEWSDVRCELRTSTSFPSLLPPPHQVHGGAMPRCHLTLGASPLLGFMGFQQV